MNRRHKGRRSRGAPVQAQADEAQRSHGGAAGIDSARAAGRRSGPGGRGVARFRARDRLPEHRAVRGPASERERRAGGRALLDPVANTLDLRRPFIRRARRASAAPCRRPMSACRILPISTTCWPPDEAVRAEKSTRSCCAFSMPRFCSAPMPSPASSAETRCSKWTPIWRMFEEVFIPLLEQAKARGLTFRVEQCPMPGWNVTDKWHNNIAYAPGPWIALHRICERHGVGDQFRIHYDPRMPS